MGKLTNELWTDYTVVLKINKFHLQWKRVTLLCCLFGVFLFLSGCGTLTGIPGHGGGKRFAIEQELVSATVRASIKGLDVKAIQGKKATLYVNSIGDRGNGNLYGGRYSIAALFRGEAISEPSIQETSTFPTYSTAANSHTSTTSSTAGPNSNTGTNSSASTSTTTSGILHATPSSRTTTKDGAGKKNQIDLKYKGLGSYQNSDQVVPKDIQFFSAALQTYLFLKRVNIVPPSEAEVDIYFTIDVFGTIRSRIEWFIANNEVLKAKTALEMMVVDHNTGEIIIAPEVSSYEAEYNEQYIAWVGPINVKKRLYKSDGLLCDYTDIINNDEELNEVEKDIPLMYPFKSQIINFLTP